MDLKDVKEELLSKSEAALETETALKWMKRACGCYELSTEAKDHGTRVAWIMRGEDNRHEALEHASLVEDDGDLVREVQETMKPYRKKALELEIG